MTEALPDQPIVEALSMSYGPPEESRFDRIVVLHNNELRDISECTAGLVAWMVTRGEYRHFAVLNEAANTIKIHPPLGLELAQLVIGAVAKNTGTKTWRLVDRGGQEIIQQQGVWMRVTVQSPPVNTTGELIT